MGLVFQASAPGRCGILGNPSDIYGGKVLSCSIPARARCRIELGDREELPGDRRLWDAAVSRFPLQSPVRVTWQTDVPRSSGLSGSTALLAATLACVLAADQLRPTLDEAGRIAFAELLRDIERHEAGIMCGFQDAYMITHGGLQLMDFAGKHPVELGPPARMNPLPLREGAGGGVVAGLGGLPSPPPRPSPSRGEGEPLPFLLTTTGVERLSGSVHGPMSERWLNGEAAVVNAISRISQLAEPGAQALINRDLAVLAELMNENQRLIGGVGGSGEAVDHLVQHCLSNGALAAKLAGAGLGGTIIALTEDPDELQQRLSRLGYARFLRPAIAEGIRFEEPTPRAERSPVNTAA